MTRKFLTDQEINLNDNDFLKTKVYADNLAKIIRNTEADKVFTVGLYGSWGSGKSSIIETAKQSFDEKKDKVKFVTYDAWQYSNDSFRRMFLRTLSKELNYSETDFMKRFYENESMDVDNRFKLSSDRVSLLLFGLLVLIIIIWAIPIEIDTKVPIYAVFTVLSLLVTLFTGAFHQLKISVTKPYFFAPEQFEECFKEIASKSLKTNTVKDDLKYLVANDKTIKNLKKLVIVIDNIDRCNSEIAYQLLTDIKTFLGSQKFNIVFVIPVDDKALLKNFFSKETNTIKYNDKEEFLRKIFNVTLRIKPYNATDMFAFTKSICEHSKLQFKNETINIIGKEYSNNPRRVIQLINNLIVELNNYDSKFAKENEIIICCILIIREEYPDFYDSIYANASRLKKYVPKDNDDKDIKEIDRFMRTVSAEFINIENSILNKVLLNVSNRFSTIDVKVIEMINSFDSEGLCIYFKENKEIDNEVYYYLCDKIDEAHDNELDTDLSRYMQLIGMIHIEKFIPEQFLLIIFEKFKSKLSSIFHDALNIDILIKLVEYEKNHFKYNLKKELLNKIDFKVNSSDVDQKERWLVIFNSLIKNLTDDETSKKIINNYESNYTKLVSVDELTENQFKILVTNKFIRIRVGELDTFDTNSKKYILFKDILSRFEDKLFVLNTLFAKFNSTDIYKNFTDSRFEYLVMFNDLIVFSNSINIIYEGKFLEKNLSELFSKIEVYEDQKPLHYVDFFKVFEKETEKLEFILELLFNYYSFTKKLAVIEQFILNIDHYISQSVREKMVLFLNEGENINFYFNRIIYMSNYSDNNLIILKKHFLSLQDEDFKNSNKKNIISTTEELFIWISDEEYQNKINDILEHTIEKNGSFDLIAEAINSRYIKDKSFDYLEYFSEKVKQSFADNVDQISIDNYLDNNILKLAFETDNENLNGMFIENIGLAVTTLSELDKFLIKIVELVESNKEKQLSLQIKNEIELLLNKVNFNRNRNSTTDKRIKDNLVKLGILDEI